MINRARQGVNELCMILFADCICSGRTGSVQQQYRPRSPAAALTQGNAVSHTPPQSTAPPPGHTEPVGKGLTARAN